MDKLNRHIELIYAFVAGLDRPFYVGELWTFLVEQGAEEVEAEEAVGRWESWHRDDAIIAYAPDKLRGERCAA